MNFVHIRYPWRFLLFRCLCMDSDGRWHVCETKIVSHVTCVIHWRVSCTACLVLYFWKDLWINLIANLLWSSAAGIVYQTWIVFGGIFQRQDRTWNSYWYVSGGQTCLLPALDMVKVGGPLLVVKVSMCEEQVSVSGWSLIGCDGCARNWHPKSIPHYFSLPIFFFGNSCQLAPTASLILLVHWLHCGHPAIKARKEVHAANLCSSFQLPTSSRQHLLVGLLRSTEVIFHLASWLRTPRFSEPAFGPPEPQNIGKTQCFATFLPFRAPTSSPCLIFSLLTFSTSEFLPGCAFPSVHIVGSLASKLPSISETL